MFFFAACCSQSVAKNRKKKSSPQPQKRDNGFWFSLDFHVLAPATKVFHKLPWFLQIIFCFHLFKILRSICISCCFVCCCCCRANHLSGWKGFPIARVSGASVSIKPKQRIRDNVITQKIQNYLCNAWIYLNFPFCFSYQHISLS